MTTVKDTPTNSMPIRLRFAPAPTGWMHLGNVRAAYMNALFAKKNNGHMILRIEDTDGERIIDVGGKQIMKDLAWLGITYDEGPFFQSDRTELYQKYLNIVIERNLVYRAFETPEELETQRALQRAQSLPPCYNRASLQLTQAEIDQKLANNVPFVWRFKLPHGQVSFYDIARGQLTFDLTHISDFAVTRQDGSFTFMFANFVDDMLMNITYILRGEDHMTNSACQIPLYQAFDLAIPIFYHLPIICNAEGKKLSKRDFGFSLDDLHNAGFIPEAICNYLAIIGGSFKEEIMDFDTLAATLKFDTSRPAGTIQYDVEKLRWFNHKWIGKLSVDDLVSRCMPFLIQQFPQAAHIENIKELIAFIQPDMTTLHDSVELLSFYFTEPKPDHEVLEHHNFTEIAPLISSILAHYADKDIDADAFVNELRQASKTRNLALKEVFAIARLLLTGSPQGLSVKLIIVMLGSDETKRRFGLLLK